MQVANANPHVTVTGRHLAVTSALSDYAQKRVEGLHLDYPKIIEAHVILDVEKFRQRAEIVLTCSNHITIEASVESDDLYVSIDGVVSKIARQMRKHKTRFLRTQRPHRNGSVRYLEAQLFPADAFATLDGHLNELFGGNGHAPGTPSTADATAPAVAEPLAATPPAPARPAVRTEPYPVKPMFVDEAVLQLQMSEEQPFLVFHNANNGKVNVLYRRKTGDFGLIEPTAA